MLWTADPLGAGFDSACAPDDCGAALDCPAVACCCHTPPPDAAPRLTPALATAAPTEVTRTASSIANARIAPYSRRSLNDTSPCLRRNYRSGAMHAYPSRYHHASIHEKRRAENSRLIPIAPLRPAILAENLHRHAGASGNRYHLRAHEVRANSGSHQVVSCGQRGTHVCGARRHCVLRVHVIDGGLQLNVHRSRSGRETDLPTNRAAILRKARVARQRELLAGLPRSRAFIVES